MRRSEKILWHVIVALFAILIFVTVGYSDTTIMVAKKKGGSSGYNWANVKQGEWRFEDGALTTDSSGKTNTLSTSGVTANTSTYKQGSASGEFSGSSSYAGRADSGDNGLSTGFPGKSSTGYQNFLIMAWFYLDTTDSTGYDIFSKYYAGTNQRSFKLLTSVGALKVNMSSPALEGNSASVSKTFGSGDGFPDTLSTGRWYHVGFYHDSTLDKWGLRLWDDNTSTTYDYSIAYSDGVYLGLATFGIGASISTDFGGGIEFFDGKMDQVVVYSWADGSNPTEAEILSRIYDVRTGTSP